MPRFTYTTWLGRVGKQCLCVRAILMLGLAFYAVFVWRHSGACAGGADSAGYLNHARLLASGAALASPRELEGLPADKMPPYLYVPLGFKVLGASRQLVPIYSSGLPLLLAGAAQFTGWEKPGDWVIGAHAVAGLLLVYLLGIRLGLSPWWSLAGAAIIGGSPLYLDFAFQMMSDVPALVWTGAAVLAALWSRERAVWALGSGFALALAVLIRPSNLLLVAPVLAALGLPVGWAWLKRSLYLVLGGLPGLATLLVINQREYGAFFTTGYGDASDLFSWANVAASLPHFGLWLPLLFGPLAIAALGLPWLSREAGRTVCVLGSWIVVILGFYAAYAYTHETWWYLRFILPAAPALVIAGLLVTQRMCVGFTSRVWTTLVLGLVLGCTAWVYRVQYQRLYVLAAGEGERVYVEVAEWARTQLPANAIVAAEQGSGALYYYTAFPLVRWTVLDDETFRRVYASAQASGRPLYAILFPCDSDAALGRKSPGTWVQVGKVRELTIWECKGL